MKRTIALLVIICLAISFYGCGNTNTNNYVTPTETTDIPSKFEDRLIEDLKISDSKDKVEEVFGKPDKESLEDTGSTKLTFNNIKIFGEKFVLTVTTRNDYVSALRYDFDGSSEAKRNVAYKKLIDNFTLIYDEPFDSNDKECKWYFEDGSYLWVFMSYNIIGEYRVGIHYDKG